MLIIFYTLCPINILNIDYFDLYVFYHRISWLSLFFLVYVMIIKRIELKKLLLFY